MIEHIKDLDSMWPIASEELSRSILVSDDEMTLEQLTTALYKDLQRLFAIKENDEIVGWMVVKITSYPNKKILVVTHIAGHRVAQEEGFNQLQDVARSYGCTQIQIYCKEAQARLWRQSLGFQETYRVMRFNLNKDNQYVSKT